MTIQRASGFNCDADATLPTFCNRPGFWDDKAKHLAIASFLLTPPLLIDARGSGLTDFRTVSSPN